MDATRMRVARSARRTVGNVRGETITEVLVAMVIVGLALLVLAMVIASSSNIVRSSRESMDEFFSTANQLSAYAEGGESAVATSTGTVTVTSDGGAIALDPAVGASIPVTASIGTDAEEPVASYEEGGAA